MEEVLDTMRADEYLDWIAYLEADQERARHQADKRRKGIKT